MHCSIATTNAVERAFCLCIGCVYVYVSSRICIRRRRLACSRMETSLRTFLVFYYLPNLLAHPFLYLPVCHFIISVTFSDAFKQICYNSVTPSIITMINPFSYAISHGISILVYWMVLSGYQIDDNIDRQQCTLYMNA